MLQKLEPTTVSLKFTKIRRVDRVIVQGKIAQEQMKRCGLYFQGIAIASSSFFTFSIGHPFKTDANTIVLT